ncbi:MAG: crossover junction endodeoxyribonuclease RuvC [Elusimicrobia bacterium CG1_02_63_36]|nr:MAG: crossover junction endodeoxyribonuclease RuvC [Elusimicrobia bacterium CG1_02_63_36]PIP81970.1 MAG: crossover junction endodeoxyribonuclease RuvC [Elusimicrobia bacterium CG22_combo_CG10-13_8_21_14_all_63_91]PJA18471.1 MAG: crossover junction endodeoxyribonuclease RuvC [Elusimicrobia bacterium CG_4_10_14_0_2_um_filter_63_34]PJB24506.1 MAG: crossover junction endodeoxyribonuclease RuvC [Elusimicrobia bacterium CG_4_9_14_3_um_filter_62_55]
MHSGRVLGIDPGVSETGWAVLEGDPPRGVRLVASGCIRTSPRTPFPRRLREIHDLLSAVLSEHAPAEIAIEEMFFAKAAHTIRRTLQARGVALLAATRDGALLREYNPKQVKLSLTGSGSAPKAQMQKMVQSALGLASRLTPDDVADAAAIALCHLRAGRAGRMKVLDRLGGGGA